MFVCQIPIYVCYPNLLQAVKTFAMIPYSILWKALLSRIQLHWGQRQCTVRARYPEGDRGEKRGGQKNSLTARLHRPASLLQASLPSFFAFPVPIKDHKMRNWPINEKRLALVRVHLNFRSIFSWLLQLFIIICQLVAISQTEACGPWTWRHFW